MESDDKFSPTKSCFVAAESNSLMLAIFTVVCGVSGVKVCVGGGRNRQAGCLSGLFLLILWGPWRRRGAAVLDHVPGQM